MNTSFDSKTKHKLPRVTKWKVSPYDKKWHLNLSLGFGNVNNAFVLITGLKAEAFGGTASRIL